MKKRLHDLYILGTLTWERFSSVEGPEAAAAIAYYALFSLFPMLLVMTVSLSAAFDPTDAVGTLSLGTSPDRMYSQVMTFAQNFFPGSEEVVRRTMDQIIASKGTSFWSWGGIVGFGFLLWSASSVFAGIIQNINQAWHSSPPRHFVLERVLGIADPFPDHLTIFSGS
jgi:membrane protein